MILKQSNTTKIFNVYKTAILAILDYANTTNTLLTLANKKKTVKL